MLTSHSYSSRVPKKGTRAAPSILLLLEDFVKSFFLGISVFPRELLSGKLWAVFKKAELVKLFVQVFPVSTMIPNLIFVVMEKCNIPPEVHTDGEKS